MTLHEISGPASCSWRSQIFDAPLSGPISIPFSPDAKLSLVHVEDVATMLFSLAEAFEVNFLVYNTPAEIWEVNRLKELIEKLRGIHVELGSEDAAGGPICDGSRFTQEFKFPSGRLRDRLSVAASGATSVTTATTSVGRD